MKKTVPLYAVALFVLSLCFAMETVFAMAGKPRRSHVINLTNGNDNFTIALGTPEFPDSIVFYFQGRPPLETIPFSECSGGLDIYVHALKGNDFVSIGSRRPTDPLPEAVSDCYFKIYGEGGVDTLSGGNGDDFLDGGADHDRLEGHSGNDRLLGGGGDDILIGDYEDCLISNNPHSFNDILIGGPGNDIMGGDCGNNTLLGEDGDDVLFVYFGGSNFFSGGKGNDILIKNFFGERSAGPDKMDGGDGDDLICDINRSSVPNPENDETSANGGRGWDALCVKTVFGSTLGSTRQTITDGNPHVRSQSIEDFCNGRNISRLIEKCTAIYVTY